MERITAKMSAYQYPEDYEALNDTLMCRFCNYEVNYKDISTVRKHLEGRKHIELKSKSANIPPSNIDNFSDTQEMIMEFVKMLTNCNIPLNKVDSMLSFLKKYVKNGGKFPGSSAIRKNYLHKLQKQQKEKYKSYIQGKAVSISIDGTKDSCSRHVLNAIINSKDSNAFLAQVDFVKIELLKQLQIYN
jgi:hypothetical protein